MAGRRYRPGRGAQTMRGRPLGSADGRVTLEGAGTLSEGDAVRFTATGEQKITAAEPAEVLLWEMHATIAGWQ